MPDDHPVHYYPISRKERIIGMVIAAVILLAALLCSGSIIKAILQ